MGQINVVVQTEERMKAISDLAIATRKLAEALSQATQVTVSNCTFNGPEIGVNVATAEEVNETMIEKVE